MLLCTILDIGHGLLCPTDITYTAPRPQSMAQQALEWRTALRPGECDNLGPSNAFKQIVSLAQGCLATPSPPVTAEATAASPRPSLRSSLQPPTYDSRSGDDQPGDGQHVGSDQVSCTGGRGPEGPGPVAAPPCPRDPTGGASPWRNPSRRGLAPQSARSPGSLQCVRSHNRVLASALRCAWPLLRAGPSRRREPRPGRDPEPRHPADDQVGQGRR